jgi:uncharacterized membrane protein
MAATAVLWSIALAAAVVGIGFSIERLRYPSSAVYALASWICHQRPERSFATAGAPWPVCARCAGLYAGAVIGTLTALCFEPPREWDHLVQSTRRWLPLAAVPTAGTLAVEWVSGEMPGHLLRALGAVPLGAAIGAVLVLAVAWPPRTVAIH